MTEADLSTKLASLLGKGVLSAPKSWGGVVRALTSFSEVMRDDVVCVAVCPGFREAGFPANTVSINGLAAMPLVIEVEAPGVAEANSVPVGTGTNRSFRSGATV